MNKQRFLVVSSANIDFVQRMRRLPYAGETIVENYFDFSYLPGGKGANSAIALARFGADCVFACKLGRDANAKRLIQLYQSEGIDTRYIREDPDAPTGMASIMVEAGGNNRIVVYPGANSTMTAEDVEEYFTCYPDALFVHLEVPDEAVVEACHWAHEDGIPVFVDAGPARADYPLRHLGRVEIFSPNEAETRVFTGIYPSTEENCLRAAIKLSSMVDAKYIVIKRGEKGAFLYDGREYFVIPAEDVEAVDTTGAGDVFTAVMAFVYLQNKNILSAIKYATCAAALAVTREGASSSIPTKEEVLAYVKNKRQAEEAKANEEDPEEEV